MSHGKRTLSITITIVCFPLLSVTLFSVTGPLMTVLAPPITALPVNQLPVLLSTASQSVDNNHTTVVGTATAAPINQLNTIGLTRMTYVVT